MGKYVYLLKNISFLTISNIATKLLAFILIPIYSRYLSTAEYGIVDIIQNLINIMFPILTICMSQSIIIFVMNPKYDKKEIFNILLDTLKKSIWTVVVLASIYMILTKQYIIVIYSVVFYFMYSLYNLLIEYVRSIEKMKVLVKANISIVLTNLISIILLLIVLNTGINGYFISLIASYIIGNLILIKGARLYQIYIEKRKQKIDYELKKELCNYSKPLIANSIGWWINSAADRYIILYFLGINATGIYSMSYKIPTMLTLVQNIFIQAWEMSVMKEYSSDEKRKFLSQMYDIYNFVLIVITVIILTFLDIISKIIFSVNFYEAKNYVPFLLVSVIFGALSGFVGTIFAAEKNSKIYSKSTVIGAVINIILNIILIPKFGLYGAAIATMICYIAIWAIRLINVKKYNSLKVNYSKSIISYIILLIQIVLIAINRTNLLINIIIFIVIISINISLIKDVIKKCLRKVKE